MTTRVFDIAHEFTLNKGATLESHVGYWTVASTSSRLKSPGIISTTAVSLPGRRDYDVIVSGKKLSGSAPYIYISTTSHRTYITSTTWSQTIATFRLDTDQNVKVGVLLENADDGDSVDVWEIILREHIPNFAQVKFDMGQSDATTLQKSEIVAGRIKFRWNKALTRLEIASATDQIFALTIMNHLNAYNHNSNAGDTPLRNGFVTVGSDYVLFFTDVGDVSLSVPTGSYIEYSFTAMVDGTNETYKIDVLTDGLDCMTIKIQGG